MKAIIIGIPCRGISSLVNMLEGSYKGVAIISIDDLRKPLGIYEPNKGYETEISPANMPYFMSIINAAMAQKENVIVAGYGLAPEDALKLGKEYQCPVVLLCHKDVPEEEELYIAKDTEECPSKSAPYAHQAKLYEFYKTVEKKWIERMPKSSIFATDTDTCALENAYKYLIKNQAPSTGKKRGTDSAIAIPRETGQIGRDFSKRPIDRDRLAHMSGVAEYMYKNIYKYPKVKFSPQQMYVVGLLHDIGYIYGDIDGHERHGAELIQECFSPGCPYHISQLAEIISHHGVNPLLYEMTHDFAVPDELKLLWEANMSVDMTGTDVGFEKRLAEIGRRYGTDSHIYSLSKKTIEWLMEN